jgi:hypothetical protein
VGALVNSEAAASSALFERLILNMTSSMPPAPPAPQAPDQFPLGNVATEKYPGLFGYYTVFGCNSDNCVGPAPASPAFACPVSSAGQCAVGYTGNAALLAAFSDQISQFGFGTIPSAAPTTQNASVGAVCAATTLTCSTAFDYVYRDELMANTTGGASACFNSPSNSTPIDGCTCDLTCATCGYTPYPTGTADCITCAAGLTLAPVYTDGTGMCLSPTPAAIFAACSAAGAAKEVTVYGMLPPSPSNLSSTVSTMLEFRYFGMEFNYTQMLSGLDSSPSFNFSYGTTCNTASFDIATATGIPPFVCGTSNCNNPTATAYVSATATLGGYSVASFGSTQQTQFVGAMASVLKTTASALSVQSVTSASVRRRELLAVGVAVAFTVQTPLSGTAAISAAIGAPLSKSAFQSAGLFAVNSVSAVAAGVSNTPPPSPSPPASTSGAATFSGSLASVAAAVALVLLMAA